MERLVLDIVFPQGKGRDRLGHFITQIERVGGIDFLPILHLREQGEGVGALEKNSAIQYVD